MSTPTRFILAAPLVFALTACDAREPTSPQLAGPEARVNAAAAGGGRQILMLDACDPVTFNAFFGFEVCTPTSPRRGISFNTFVDQLEKKQRVDAWRFAPEVIRVNRTITATVINKGGIEHSLTEVAEYGGGFIGILNFLSGNLVPAPECVHPTIPNAPNPGVDLIAPGDARVVELQPGHRKYICCIHPWMRAETM